LKKILRRVLNKCGYDIVKLRTTIDAQKSYSQCGEDLIVDYIFKLRGIDLPTYIDIGAHDPFYLSNTAKFYDRGCKGINIEANPDLIQAFYTFRPNDINLNIGISDEEGSLDFYIMEDNTLSTFSKEECDFMVSNGKAFSRVQKIKLATLSQILNQNFAGNFPDFLSIDVEGMDFQILKSIDFKKAFPKIICCEAAEYSPIGTGDRREEIISLLETNGYYEYANTNLNAIMVRREFWFI
jgi:FkbM family methyltransferase